MCFYDRTGEALGRVFLTLSKEVLAFDPMFYYDIIMPWPYTLTLCRTCASVRTAFWWVVPILLPSIVAVSYYVTNPKVTAKASTRQAASAGVALFILLVQTVTWLELGPFFFPKTAWAWGSSLKKSAEITCSHLTYILHQHTLHLHIVHLHIFRLHIWCLHILHLRTFRLHILHLHILHLRIIHLQTLCFHVFYLHILHLSIWRLHILHLHTFRLHIWHLHI